MCAVTSTSQPEVYRPDMEYVWVMYHLDNNTVTDTKYIQRPNYDTNVSCYGQEKGSNLTSSPSDGLYLRQPGIHVHLIYYNMHNSHDVYNFIFKIKPRYNTLIRKVHQYQ